MAKKLPILTSRGIIVFPGNQLPMEIGRKYSVNAVSQAQNNASEVILLSQKDPNKDNVLPQDLFLYGTVTKFHVTKVWDDHSKRVMLTSLRRVKVTNIVVEKNCLFGDYEELTEFSSNKKQEEFFVKNLIGAMDEIISKAQFNNIQEIKEVFQNIEGNKIADILATYLPMNLTKRQKLLEELDVTKRLEIIYRELTNDKMKMSVDMQINKKVNEKLNNQQREYLLRERLRAIKEELGEIDSKDSEIDKYHKKLANNPYPESLKKKIKDELNRYEACPPGSQEANVIKTYVDWIFSLPWWEKTLDNDDLIKVRKTLDRNHYGLTKVKERILEYLAIRTRNKKPKAPILCLVGPPGVGKTSLGRSIADALDKKFVKMSLGGVRDEAEIRGHRKTYLGSMPGRIVQGLKKAGVINPLFLLDEIDKMSADSIRGDPASAMLEVLDPEQNRYFSDHYIEEEYDLSDVMFICTANYMENIPAPLLDRMELISLSSYTEREKLAIAKKHLIPHILNELRISKTELRFNDASLLYIIQRYTREAGVRALERLINKVARKFIIDVNSKKITKLLVNPKIILKYLGKEDFDFTLKDKESRIGTVTGLAYTAYGGDILPIEATAFPGKGRLILTGKLGDVMKESATIALGFLRANAVDFNINFDFEKSDIHIHVPEGAVPKDGPSAGVTIATTLASLLTNTAIDPAVGMTGELTLRGLVLKIGGLKEKLISAFRSGLSRAFIPLENVKDLDEIPPEVSSKLEVIPVSEFSQVYNQLFVQKTNSKKTKKRIM